MHLITILSYAFIFWRSETSNTWSVIGQGNATLTIVIVFLQPVILGLLGWGICRRTLQQVHRQPDKSLDTQHFHHRALFIQRILLLLGFGLSVLFTPWPDLINSGKLHPVLQIVGNMIVLLPFFMGCLAIWLTAYPVERIFKSWDITSGQIHEDQSQTFSLSSYLDFNIRHQVLIVAVPMTLILFASNLTRSYDTQLRETFHWIWASDAVLAIVAGSIFMISPLMLRRIWRTEPLEDGPLRQRLNQLCRDLGLRYRDILVWKSGGMMINAAVMGVIPPVRYILLSDALLSTMDTRQIEAVFGHEAGHIRHRHIQQFLLLAFIGWVIVAGFMEFLARFVTSPQSMINLSMLTIQGLGVVAMVLFWAVIFGWVSRRFERQADVFGAKCVTPSSGECNEPCSVHQENQTVDQAQNKICVTGASVFVSALDRVAVLNGIPKEERSWRHSSIGSRIRFLMSLAGDPKRVQHFERVIHRIKLFLWSGAIVGMVLCMIFWWSVPQPALLKIQTGGM